VVHFVTIFICDASVSNKNVYIIYGRFYGGLKFLCAKIKNIKCQQHNTHHYITSAYTEP